MRDFASTQERQKCEAKKKGEDDRRKGEEMRRAAMTSMFQYIPVFSIHPCCYCNAGRISSPSTSLEDEEDDELDEDYIGSSSKKIKLSKGIYYIAHGSIRIPGEIH